MMGNLPEAQFPASSYREAQNNPRKQLFNLSHACTDSRGPFIVINFDFAAKSPTLEQR